MTYRFATEADLDLLAEWNHQLIEDEKADNPMTVGQLAIRLRDWLDSGDYKAAVFGIEGRDIAYALFAEYDDRIHLRQFFVDRSNRRRGYGLSALKLLRSKIWPATHQLTVDVLAHNSDAYTFWRHCGYRATAIRMSQT